MERAGSTASPAGAYIVAKTVELRVLSSQDFIDFNRNHSPYHLQYATVMSWWSSRCSKLSVECREINVATHGKKKGANGELSLFQFLADCTLNLIFVLFFFFTFAQHLFRNCFFLQLQQCSERRMKSFGTLTRSSPERWTAKKSLISVFLINKLQRFTSIHISTQSSITITLERNRRSCKCTETRPRRRPRESLAAFIYWHKMHTIVQHVGVH